MKKISVVVLLLVAGAVFGQNGIYDFIPLSINMVISELGKPVPPEYCKNLAAQRRTQPQSGCYAVFPH